MPAVTAASIAPLQRWLHATPRVPPAPIRDDLGGDLRTGFVGARLSPVSPAAQRIASAMSDSEPPHLPSARTGRILTVQADARDARRVLLAVAAMMPAL